jgi:hypothetical protein
MKTANTFRLIFLLLVFFATACVDEIARRPCRISQVYWEGQWFDAFYSGSGRLLRLEADTSKVDFHYNGADQLIKAEIYGTDPDPKYRFEFAHGPFGIVETNEYHPSIWGEYRTRTEFHYAGPSVVDYLIHEEYGVDPVPGFVIQYDITYSGGNVKLIDGTSSVITTDYIGSRYDKKKNPFKVLAAAVGNPAFFPACKMVNYPVATYDISYLSIFSSNNPLRGQYEVPGVDPAFQTFANHYAGAIADKITWSSSSYGVVTSNEYAFKLECGHHAGGE